jgi:hypothetical protein
MAPPRDDGEPHVPEWAMLELNGEILPPLVSTINANSETGTKAATVELGSVRMLKVRKLPNEDR